MGQVTGAAGDVGGNGSDRGVEETPPAGTGPPVESTLVGVCGGSGSGKTTLAHRLVEALGADQAICLSFDSYYRDLAELSVEERAQVNFDHPDSLDVAMLVDHLRLLRGGREIAVPHYDFVNHTRSADIDLVEPHRYVIVEGILLFAFPEIRAELDVLVFRQCDEATRAERRLRRDVTERGRSPESVRQQWATTVQPMHELHVEPYARHADVVTTQDQELDAIVARLAGSLRSTPSRAS
ncbi:MAG: uridine kinase [Actinomycetota bacterium]